MSVDRNKPILPGLRRANGCLELMIGTQGTPVEVRQSPLGADGHGSQ